MGMGVSGGEEGARTGPSIMPGGEEEAYTFLRPLLEAVSAKVNGVPCVAYLGKHAAGHYVKMVHNGIEYGIMQMISECYDMLKNGIGLSNDELSAVFDNWDKTDMTSYLVEITAAVLKYNDEKTNNRLVDMILDKAGSKGTGKWTSQDALDLPSPIPTIDMAVTMRNLSSFKDERVAASKIYPPGNKKIDVDRETFIQQVHDALFFATLMSYVQGLAMLQKASKTLEMDIPMPEVVKVWRGGCIIRSSLLDVFINAFQKDPLLTNLLFVEDIANLLMSKEQNLREVIVQAARHGFPAGSLMASLSYFDAYRTANLPTNLIQAQRDYFGAHTYQRTDDPTGVFHHTEWMQQVKQAQP
jgi:6-phosphogluconate dehydrogenase